jgi:hypothetical protein
LLKDIEFPKEVGKPGSKIRLESAIYSEGAGIIGLFS